MCTQLMRDFRDEIRFCIIKGLAKKCVRTEDLLPLRQA